jgi:hypothetical protein
MALQRAKLSDIQFISTTAGIAYSNPAGVKTYIRGIIIFNANTVSETVKLYNVPDDNGSVGIASTSNQFMNTLVSSNETLFIEIPYVITLTDTNETIQASTTTSSRVTLQILGDKE